MIRAALFVLTLLSLGGASAQVAPAPANARFLDPDPAARVFFANLDSERGLAKLRRHIERHPGDSRGWSARAYWHALQGDADAALADLERARGVIDRSPLQVRETLWAEGWARLNLGHIPEAGAAWTEAMRMHGGQPFWVPYTFAVLAELGGERHTALGWYQIAARNRPTVWGTRRGLLDYTRHWRDGERTAMLELYQAWSAEQTNTLTHPPKD